MHVQVQVSTYVYDQYFIILSKSTIQVVFTHWKLEIPNTQRPKYQTNLHKYCYTGGQATSRLSTTNINAVPANMYIYNKENWCSFTLCRLCLFWRKIQRWRFSCWWPCWTDTRWFCWRSVSFDTHWC